MDDRLKANRAAWNEMTDRHVAGGGGYRVDDFRAGDVSLEPNIPDDIGDVRGKTMLHLQCHFGMDSLMWARNDAIVTGVDFSPRAVEEARRLSDQTGLDATFIESDIAALPETLGGQFDIVITYFGTIVWLPDIRRWGEVAASFVKPGGLFYIADTHPLLHTYEFQPDGKHPERVRPYFTKGRAERYETEEGTYADPKAQRNERVTYEWQHTLADVSGALIDAGLELEYLHEFPYTFYNVYYYIDRDPSPMIQNPEGWWQMREGPDDLPLMFSMRAKKPLTGAEKRE